MNALTASHHLMDVMQANVMRYALLSGWFNHARVTVEVRWLQKRAVVQKLLKFLRFLLKQMQLLRS